MNLTDVSEKILSKWRERLEELDNEEGAEFLDFDICQSIMITTLKEEAVKEYHRSEGNKHKFIREFFDLTDEDVKGVKMNKGCGKRYAIEECEKYFPTVGAVCGDYRLHIEGDKPNLCPECVKREVTEVEE